jgi:RNA polymerase sigma-70 factor (ECF subfamily)
MLQTYSEDLLIQRCREGERKAQRQLYERFAPGLMAICRRYLRQQEEAEEALSNAVLKVFRNIDDYSHSGSLEGWVKRITVNECLNHLRKRKEVFTMEIEEEIAPSFTADPHEYEDLQRVVEHLPSGYRTVFNLYAIEGFSHKEISKELGITENASRSQLSKARKQLRSWLEQREIRMNNGR